MEVTTHYITRLQYGIPISLSFHNVVGFWGKEVDIIEKNCRCRYDCGKGRDVAEAAPCGVATLFRTSECECQLGKKSLCHSNSSFLEHIINKSF